MIDKLRKYIDEGRKFNAAYYSVRADFLEDLLKFMEAQEQTIQQLRDAMLDIAKDKK